MAGKKQAAERLSRRQFGFGCAGLGTTTLFSSLVHLGAMSSAAQTVPAGSGYKALVCVLLAGGNDSFNMLVPAAGAEHREYELRRSDLALGINQLLPLRVQNTPGRSFGLHPSMPRIGQLFDRGEVAFATNIGTLIEPVSLESFKAKTAALPLGLFSHADQIEQWQTALPDKRAATGWGGRLADILGAGLGNGRVSMNISLGGTNVFQSGQFSSEFSISEEGSGAVNIEGFGEPDPFYQLRDAAITSMLNAQYANIFEQAYVDRLRSSIDSNIFFGEAIASAPPLQTAFAADTLSQQLNMVARTISARGALGNQRQTFFVILDDFDHHDEVLQNQAELLGYVDMALGSFYEATRELGVEQDVTTFTISDFGRTLASNGRGSDHGWGGNQLIMGGAVDGAKFYGQYPRLAGGAPLDTGRGRLIPTRSVDEYFAELALWFGVERSALDMVLPNVGRFYSPSSRDAPMGFLAQSQPVIPPLRRRPR